MNQDAILLQLTSHVASLTGTAVEQIASDQPLDRLGLDSMGFVDLLVYIEKNFNVSLTASGLSQDDFSSLSMLAQRIVGIVQQ